MPVKGEGIITNRWAIGLHESLDDKKLLPGLMILIGDLIY
jgi:hypothetical protein